MRPQMVHSLGPHWLSSSLPLLFCKPKKVIIFDENIVGSGINFCDNNKYLSRAFACHKDGFSLKNLRILIAALKGKPVTLVYCIRDIHSYIQSIYCEKIKWTHFEDFESYTKQLMDELKYISWEYICTELSNLCASQDLEEPVIVSYEQIKDDIMSFIRFLVQSPQDITLRDFESFNFLLSESVVRASPSKEAVTLAFQSLRHKNRRSAQNLYKKLVLSSYGSTKFEPLSDKKFFRLAMFISDTYELNKESLVTYQALCGKSSDLCYGSFNKSASTFDSLSDSVSPYVNRVDFLSENRSDDSDTVTSNVLWNTFSCFEHYTNLENNIDFEFDRSHYGLSKETGISALLRIKNEEHCIKQVLLDCLKVFDEVVVVDNNSSDDTLAIVVAAQLNIPDIADQIKVYSYPFDVARCGLDNYLCPENSVHSLAYFYNFCLSKCRYSHVYKWDGDMFLPNDMLNSFKNFKTKVLESSSTFSTSSATVCGEAVGIAVYKGHNNKYYFRPAETQCEVRLFENRADVRFVKDILWEKLFFPHSIKTIKSSCPISIEFKDVSKNEYDHWQTDALGMAVRAKIESSNFKSISQLTSRGRDPSVDELARFGFEEYLDFSERIKFPT